jgi:hypothetical protein
METTSKYERQVLKRQKESERLAKSISKQRNRENISKSFSNSFKFSPNIPYRRGSKVEKVNRVDPMSVPDLNLHATKAVYEDEDLAAREAAAQEELNRKKKQIAPLFSKGAYQYITDESLLHDIGKKK